MDDDTLQNPTLNRRKFIRRAIAGTILVGVPALVLKECDLFSHKHLRPEDVLLDLCGVDAVHIIGKNWINNHPQEATASQLKQKLLQGSRLKDYDQASQNARSKHLQSSIRADFAQSNTLMAEGWILTPTECRVAALYYLNKAQQS
ncbi:MAG: hypothetical protein KA821_08880 [Chitinophagaceae bacterium]|nr:hypothetical protein [Chitinophagaceae bacterium]